MQSQVRWIKRCRDVYLRKPSSKNYLSNGPVDGSRGRLPCHRGYIPGSGRPRTTLRRHTKPRTKLARNGGFPNKLLSCRPSSEKEGVFQATTPIGSPLQVSTLVDDE